MISQPFYHGLFRKYVYLFGTLLNDITIYRNRSDIDTKTQTIKVPIAFGPREKFLARLISNPKQDRNVAIQLPRISFENTNFEVDTERKIGYNHITTIKKNTDSTVDILKGRQSWKITFEVTVMANKRRDLMGIVEQIVPYFDTTYNITAFLIDEFPEYSLDIPVTLDSVDFEDVYEGNFDNPPRVLTAKLNFTMGVYLFGPIRESKIIKIADVNFYTREPLDTVLESLSVQPGLTEDGNPTKYLEETIPYVEIDEDDDWDFVVTYREGKREI